MGRPPVAIHLMTCWNHSNIRCDMLWLCAIGVSCILLYVPFCRAAPFTTHEDVSHGSTKSRVTRDVPGDGGNNVAAVTSRPTESTGLDRFHITWHKYIGPGGEALVSVPGPLTTTPPPETTPPFITADDITQPDPVHSGKIETLLLDQQAEDITSSTEEIQPTFPGGDPQVRHFAWSAIPSVPGWNPYPNVKEQTFPNSWNSDSDVTTSPWADSYTPKPAGFNTNVLVTSGADDKVTTADTPPLEGARNDIPYSVLLPANAPKQQVPSVKPSNPANASANGSLTTMLYVAESSDQSTPKSVLNSVDGLNLNLRFHLKDIILAVCGTVACMFTLCMLVTFTRCCCKKQKDDSDEEQQPQSQHRSIWRRSWKRPLDSTTTTQTQESSTSENVTQVTIERHGSYADHDSGDDGDDDDDGGFTKGKGPKDSTRSGHSSRKGKESSDNKKAVSVRDRIKAFEVPKPEQQEVKVREGAKPRKNKPTSKAFEEFESKGILIGFGAGPRRRRGEDGEYEDELEDREGSCDSPLGIGLPSPTSGQSLEDTPTSSRGLEDDEGVHTMESEEDEFAAVQRNTDILKSFRRAPPPKNRSKARRSGRGRRPLRQDVSSSEQIAEEPSSGSFGSRPTSGINSPETSATPDDEEHDSFEASLHMPMTESLSAARSSSISQTPQSSLDSMDSPKRQPSISSRDSPMRASLTDSPKRQGLLDSPKWPVRESPKRSVTPQRLSDIESPPDASATQGVGVGVGATCSPGPLQWEQTRAQNGHTEFSLTIPKEFQQQRLGGQPLPETNRISLKPHRPKSYHVDVATNRGEAHRPVEKFRPIRPFSHVQIEAPFEPSSRSQKEGVGSHDKRLHEEPKSNDSSRSYNPNRLRNNKSHDPISRSHGHLSRNITSPIGRGVPYLPRSGSPAQLRRWDSEYSYLKDDFDPDGKDSSNCGNDSASLTPEYRPVCRSKTDRHKLRPTADESRIREHPHSEKLERKVLPVETSTTPYSNPDQWLQGENEVLTSEDTIDGPTDDEPPPRPPLPRWRQQPEWEVDRSASRQDTSPTRSPESPHHYARLSMRESRHTQPPDIQHHFTRLSMRDERDKLPAGLSKYDTNSQWTGPEVNPHLASVRGTKDTFSSNSANTRSLSPDLQKKYPWDEPRFGQAHEPQPSRLPFNREAIDNRQPPTPNKIDNNEASVLKYPKQESAAGKIDAIKRQLIDGQYESKPIAPQVTQQENPQVILKSKDLSCSDVPFSQPCALWERSKDIQPPSIEKPPDHRSSWKESKHDPQSTRQFTESHSGHRDQQFKTQEKANFSNWRDTKQIDSQTHWHDGGQTAEPLKTRSAEITGSQKSHGYWGDSKEGPPTRQEPWYNIRDSQASQSVTGQGPRSQVLQKDTDQIPVQEYSKQALHSPESDNPDNVKPRTHSALDNLDQWRPIKQVQRPLPHRYEPWVNNDLKEGQFSDRQRSQPNWKARDPEASTDFEKQDTVDCTDFRFESPDSSFTHASWEPSKPIHLPNRQQHQSPTTLKDAEQLPSQNIQRQEPHADLKVDKAGLQDNKLAVMGKAEEINPITFPSSVKWDTSKQNWQKHDSHARWTESKIMQPPDLAKHESYPVWTGKEQNLSYDQPSGKESKPESTPEGTKLGTLSGPSVPPVQGVVPKAGRQCGPLSPTSSEAGKYYSARKPSDPKSKVDPWHESTYKETSPSPDSKRPGLSVSRQLELAKIIQASVAEHQRADDDHPHRNPPLFKPHVSPKEDKATRHSRHSESAAKPWRILPSTQNLNHSQQQIDTSSPITPRMVPLTTQLDAMGNVEDSSMSYQQSVSSTKTPSVGERNGSSIKSGGEAYDGQHPKRNITEFPQDINESFTEKPWQVLPPLPPRDRSPEGLHRVPDSGQPAQNSHFSQHPRPALRYSHDSTWGASPLSPSDERTERWREPTPTTDNLTANESKWKQSPGSEQKEPVFRFNFDTKPTEV